MNIEPIKTGLPNNVSGIKIDLSRNDADALSNITNPYTFSQHDNVYVWWDSKRAYRDTETFLLQDTSGNPIWDASAQGFTISGDTSGISGLVVGSSTRTDFNALGGTFFGLGVFNNVVDISSISAEFIDLMGVSGGIGHWTRDVSAQIKIQVSKDNLKDTGKITDISQNWAISNTTLQRDNADISLNALKVTDNKFITLDVSCRIQGLSLIHI